MYKNLSCLTLAMVLAMGAQTAQAGVVCIENACHFEGYAPIDSQPKPTVPTLWLGQYYLDGKVVDYTPPPVAAPEPSITVVGPTPPSLTVVGPTYGITSLGPTPIAPIGGTVVGPTVVGPTVVGPTVVGPTVVGPTVVGPTAINNALDGSHLITSDGFYQTNIVSTVNGKTLGLPSILPAYANEFQVSQAYLTLSNMAQNFGGDVQASIDKLKLLPNGNEALVALSKQPGVALEILSKVGEENVSSLIAGLANTTAVTADGIAVAGLEGLNHSLETFSEAELDAYLQNHEIGTLTDNQLATLENINSSDTDYWQTTLAEEGGNENATGGIVNTNQEAYEDYVNSQSGGGASGSGSGSGSKSGGGASEGWKITGL